jgi:hypothetical protein
MSDDTKLRIEFCGEWHEVAPGTTFVIGRDADLDIDDNPYLHRRFLELEHRDGMWWLTNHGSRLTATLSEADGLFQAWVAPGAHLPLVFEIMVLRFTAGPTTYELALHLGDPPFTPGSSTIADDGTSTLGLVTFTAEQRLLVVALAEPTLRAAGSGRTQIPSSADAARRLGWALTKFNRKLDNVCQKLERAGVRGLHGEADRLASDRRARLVEYALAVRLVGPADLALLDPEED